MIPLRLLFVTGEYPPMQGGVADYTRALSLALAARGHEIAVLTSAQAQPAPADHTLALFPLVENWGWGCWQDLDAILRAWQPHLVHIQYQTAAYALRPAINLWPWRPWRPSPIPTAVTFHDLRLPYLFPKAHLVRRWVTQTLARSCTLVVATNPEDTAALRPLRPDLLEIPIGSNIPCIPPADFDRAAWRARLGLGPNATLLCYFGFLNASKGGELLIQTLAQLADAGRPAHLLMIGGQVGASDPTNQDYLQRVRASIEALGLIDCVHWTGHLPPAQVSAAFLASDICLLPYQDGVSYRRGSFMAALAHGLPIVTTPPAVPYPHLRDGETVLLAPAQAPALAGAVLRLLADPALAQRLRENADRLARAFAWEHIAARSDEAYQSIVQKWERNA
jgi:glycosyltransferase involved in cell wall biosynthesis